MSVINRMLSDLDARGATGSTQGLAGTGGLTAKAKPAAWRLPVIALTGAAAIAAVLYVPAPAPSQEAEGAPSSPLAEGAPPTPTASANPPAQGVASNTSSTSETVARAAAQLHRKTGTATGSQAAGLASTPAAVSMLPAPAPAAQALVPSAAQPAVEAAAGVLSLPPRLAQAPIAMPSRIEKRNAAQSPEQQAQALYTQAVAQAQQGQRLAAQQLLNQALAVQATHIAARHLNAVLDYESGQTERAVASLQEGLELQSPANAQRATLALLLARLQVAQGSLEAGLLTLQKHQLRGAEADGLRAGIHAQLGQHKAAGEAYAQAARAQPGNPMWWFGLGVALESDGQTQGAKQAYAQAQAIGLPREDLALYAEQRLRSLP